MVLALISTACISNVIYSLQAMLIYARTSNAMGDRTFTSSIQNPVVMMVVFCLCQGLFVSCRHKMKEMKTNNPYFFYFLKDVHRSS